MEENWVETAVRQFIVLSTTAIVPFDDPESRVRPDLVMIIQNDFFREAIREDLDNKLRKPTHGKRLPTLETTQDEWSHRHRHHMQTQGSTQVHTRVEEAEETSKQQVELWVI